MGSGEGADFHGLKGNENLGVPLSLFRFEDVVILV